MFHNRKLNNHINRINERALTNVCQDHNSTFDELIEYPYLLRNELKFTSRNIRTLWYGIETAAFVGSRI